jgi:ABC-type branched-subunit amino acid transport system substrate-binding protein
MTRRRSGIALLALSLLLLAACGQKSGVALSAAGTGAAATSDGLDGATLAPTGDTVVPGGDAGVDPAAGGSDPAAAAAGAPGGAGTGGSAAPAAGTGTAPKPGTGSAPAGSGGTAATSPAPVTTGSTRTGIDDAKKIIRIGVHAPVTGAAPIEQKTFELGRDVYFKFLKDKGGLFGGYTVEVDFRDDQFSPTVARQKCQEMVENDKVFLLIGAAGADQITSCARYAESVGVPYLSAGVNTDGLSGLKNYFAISQTYAQQAPTLAGLIKNKIGKTKVGLAVLDTPDFVDARKAAITAMQGAGLQIVADEKIPKTAGKAETDATAANLSKAGAEVVYALMSPTIYLNFTKSIHGQVGFDPELVAPGLTVGLNLVAQAGCPDVAKTQVLSPFPQLDAIESLDPDYKPAYQKYVTSGNPQQQADDIGIALWGLDKTLALMFQAAAPSADKLSRQSFLAAVTSGQEFKSNVYPPVKYSPSQHFGATTSHLLQAQCTPPQSFKTAATFVSGF